MKALAISLIFTLPLINAATAAQYELTLASTTENTPLIIPFQSNSADHDMVFHVKHYFKKGHYQLTINALDSDCYIDLKTGEALKFNRHNAIELCATSTTLPVRIFKSDTYYIEIDKPNAQLTLKRLERSNTRPTMAPCPSNTGQVIDIDVSEIFNEGDWLRDAYSGNTAQVTAGQLSLAPALDSEGLILLEQIPPNNAVQTPAFSWDNAIVYFAMTDRFHNGNPDNDNSYGRRSDGDKEIATFHGGDLAGLTEKLDYIASLGVNALWITSPLEQIHGWVGGGDDGDFKHYGYHGYYHLDWTNLDANMGTEQELRTLIEQAHLRGIKIIWDVVINHIGYATLADMQSFQFGSLYLNDDERRQVLGDKWTDWQPSDRQTWHSFNDYIDFSDAESWSRWWGKGWIRTDIGNYDSPGYDPLTMSLNFLPDIMTESQTPVPLPAFFANKADHQAEDTQRLPSAHIIRWLTQWVAEYGIDGFRVDTAKHVEKATLAELKRQATLALQQWKTTHHVDDGIAFWMTGEAWGHGAYRSDYFDHGFDSMINFEFQTDIAPRGVTCLLHMDADFQRYADTINRDQQFNLLSYLSSHDTALFYGTHTHSMAEQKRAANALLLTPGGVQIFYGDESGRSLGPSGSDPHQGTRSAMNWDENLALVKHWQRLGQFRQRHPAISQGTHRTLSTAPYYAFSRQTDTDRIMIVYVGNSNKE
ncbi:alpha-amylase [Thaumasiovibrio sp. DFM-14]|uniref:alpha-amylase n=1 Tax=Thaumasiovibrio sp. DFM-14 TaxID=3384792 RepID=UPI0039A03834